MVVAGREVLRWLAQPHIMKMQRVPFESLLLQIAEFSEEWLTSAQSLGLARRGASERVLPWDSSGSVEATAPRAAGGLPGRSGVAKIRSMGAARARVQLRPKRQPVRA
jgi:hypothetical protein